MFMTGFANGQTCGAFVNTRRKVTKALAIRKGEVQTLIFLFCFKMLLFSSFCQQLPGLGSKGLAQGLSLCPTLITVFSLEVFSHFSMKLFENDLFQNSVMMFVQSDGTWFWFRGRAEKTPHISH